MILFQDAIVNQTIEKLLAGEDYRSAVVNEINVSFFEFALEFFKEIVQAKFDNKSINIDWYKQNFITKNGIDPTGAVINSGLNRKTVTNMRGTASKTIMLEEANKNYDYLHGLLQGLEDDIENDMSISIKISYNSICVDLSLSESLVVMNVLATKKIALRGGAWSSIGKKVEKPLLDELCRLAGVPQENIDNAFFKKDKDKDFDREVDYKLISSDAKVRRIEVKLMGKGNPKSADATIARDSNIFVADTLSEQNKKQLVSRGVKYLGLKDNYNIIADFKGILEHFDIPYEKNKPAKNRT